MRACQGRANRTDPNKNNLDPYGVFLGPRDTDLTAGILEQRSEKFNLDVEKNRAFPNKREK